VLLGSDFPTIEQLKNAVNLIKETKATAQVKKKSLAITPVNFFAKPEGLFSNRFAERNHEPIRTVQNR